MNILNVHTRKINQPHQEVVQLLETLATEEDLIWPQDNWPAMRFKNGKNIGSRGGHGPIRYFISEYRPGELIEFQFTKPEGLVGSHTLEIKDMERQVLLKHTINAKAEGFSALLWRIGIRPLHDALIEDAFDKVQLYFSDPIKKNRWSLWVRILRFILK